MSSVSTSMSHDPVAIALRQNIFLAIGMVSLFGMAGNLTVAAAHPAQPTDAVARSRHGAMDDAHLSRLIEFVEARIDQPERLQVEKLVREASRDLEEFEQQAEGVRAPRAKILLADVIDRSALERERLDELHIADERSSRVNRLLIDVASVLTSEQRIRLRAEMAK